MLRVQDILMYANALLVKVDKEMFTVFYVYTVCNNMFYIYFVHKTNKL